MNYGQKIAQLRKSANMTQAQLGEKLNVSAQAVSKWEHSLAEPDLTTIKNMCKLFGISTDEFFDIEKRNLVAQEEQCAKQPMQGAYGVCVECGTMVTDDNLGQTEPKLICKKCFVKRTEELLDNEIEEKTRKKKAVQTKEGKKKKSIIFGVLAMVAVLAIGLTTTILTAHNEIVILASVLVTMFFSYGAYALVGELFLDMGDAVMDIIEFSLESPIELPMLIFDLDGDSLIAFFILKIALSILGFLAGVGLFLLGLVLGSIVSAFVFPFHMAKFNKQMKAEKCSTQQ